MEKSLFRQFKEDRRRDILIMRQGTLLQLQEKMFLTESLESGGYLDPEQLAFLAYNGDTIVPAQASQEIPTPTAFQTDDLDTFDSDFDDVPSAKAVFMANLSFYDLDVLSKIPFHDTNIKNAISYQSVQETQCSEQPCFVNDIEVDITNKKYFEFEKKELSLDNDLLLEHIIYQDVMNDLMHVDVHNVLFVNTNYLDNDNLTLESLKMENDHLMELLISQDIVHTVVNTLAAINDYKSVQQSFVDE
nr:hypothetical protein [Tanacetum cinerariifolium]